MIAHIGYHKTGTTFLQNNIYPYIKGVDFIGYAACDMIFKDLINKSPLDYDTCKTRTLLNDSIQSDRVQLFSLEGLVGSLFYNRGATQKSIADRLKDLGFTKIIISIRNQPKLLESIYVQYIQEGGVAKPKRFFNAQNKIFYWEYADYYSLIQYYFDLFGKENVLVLLQEELRTDEQESIDRLLSFIGDGFALDERKKHRHANKSLSRISVKLLRLINHFTYNVHKPSHLISKRISTWKFRFIFQNYLDRWLFSAISSPKTFIPDSSKPEIENYYKEGNRKLMVLLGSDLSKFGYPL
ncbi:MAG: sulfotransferase domain-containing protein [Bacteroidales bacterium]|nr:sulfotransferase domain-containing protein [Bacteroidales bacterium]MCF8454765.1 sulfotransferase domain-containing protein [Bacteroidales bacterium]